MKPNLQLRLPFRRETLRHDAVAGVVLGVESVPDGLATGLLAGVNPLAGLYGYLFGTLTGALVTSSTFMAVQSTGAMAMVVADVPAVHDSEDPAGALFTLSVLTGVVMLAAGLLRLGSLLRFVSNAVMVGFLSAVGINIVLGQLTNFTGYASDASSRVTRALDTLWHAGQIDARTLVTGLVTVVLIVLLERTRLGALGLVVAIALTSAALPLLGWDEVATLRDLTQVPNALPAPRLPEIGLLPALLVPALSLAFIGLVQGAGISANYPNPDGRYPEASRDFVGQGAANLAAGVFQGMPVGGSMSATALNKQAGARSRQSLVIAAVVMAATLLLAAELVEHVAMPALAGLLMVVGVRTVKPANIYSVWRTGTLQKVVLVTTFVLTMVIPLQYSVLVGVAVSLILYIVRQSNQVTVKQRIFLPDGVVIETDPPPTLPAGTAVVLQPYGSLFFAAAPVFETALPEVTPGSRHCVVILRLRGRTDLGTTFMDVLKRYAASLRAVESKLVIVSANDRIQEQLRVTGLTALIGPENIYPGDERVGVTLRAAHDDAVAWIDAQAGHDTPSADPPLG